MNKSNKFYLHLFIYIYLLFVIGNTTGMAHLKIKQWWKWLYITQLEVSHIAQSVDSDARL
jgi:hypothetical protein